MMPTPNIDAAIQEGCAVLRKFCPYPKCDCTNMPRAIEAALRAAIPKEPPAEVIEAMARAICLAEGNDPDQTILTEKSVLIGEGRGYESPLWTYCDAEARAAYKSQPIWKELWDDQ
jgi:hypothetical protein